MKKPLLVIKIRKMYHVGIILGAAHNYQFQSLKHFDTLDAANICKAKAETSEQHRRQLYGWKS